MFATTVVMARCVCVVERGQYEACREETLLKYNVFRCSTILSDCSIDMHEIAATNWR